MQNSNTQTVEDQDGEALAEFGGLHKLRQKFDIPPSSARLLESQGKIKFARVPMRGKGQRSRVLVDFNSVRRFLASCQRAAN